MKHKGRFQAMFEMQADTRITSYKPLISPDTLQYEFEQTEGSKRTVLQGRADAVRILDDADTRQRLLVVIGPCSIHDPVAAREYACRLLVLRHKHQNELEIVMRSYTEKPRTRAGWKGILNDPDIDDTFQINKGLRIARQLFIDITDMGMPLASELLDTISPQFLADLLSVGAIGARTTECQLHRELASGSSFPIGFKNSTDGSVAVAIDAIEAAKLPHHFLAVTRSGTAAVVGTSGNSDCFVILRGGRNGPNYDRKSVQAVKEMLVQTGQRAKIMVDCSHGNSEKNYKNQRKAAQALGEQIAAGETAIMGVMIESNVKEGAQKVPACGPSALEYGVSITDACIGWQETETILASLAHSVKLRRAILSLPSAMKNGYAKELFQDGNTDETVSIKVPNTPVSNGHWWDHDGQDGGRHLDEHRAIYDGKDRYSTFDNAVTHRPQRPAPIPQRESPISNGHHNGLDIDKQKSSTNNLYQLFKRTAETSTAGVTVYASKDTLTPSSHMTYRDMFQQAKHDAYLIRQIENLMPDSKVLLHFGEHSLNIRWFWAAIVAGCLPCISTPFVNDLDQRRKHLVHVNSLLENPIILTSEKLVPDFLGLEQLNLRTIETLKAGGGPETLSFQAANLKQRNGPAVLMLTSGSTGHAKAVCLRHGQLLAALDGKSQYHQTTHDDVFLNWIGMDHVANLTEVHLHAMSLGAAQVHAQATDIVMQPTLFLSLIDRHRVAYTFAPNFFLASLRRKLEADIDLQAESKDLDLSSLRALISGGEANVVETCAALTKHLHRYRARGEFIRPGFGMTETCAGSIYGKSCPSYDLKSEYEFASLGSCIPGIDMRIITDDGKSAVANEIGSLQVSGPVVFAEYFNNPQATTETFTPDGWFITGDRAMIDTNGYLNLAGRSKDSIIINGVKYFPHELETALDEADILGITPSYNAVFPHRPKGSETESLCVVYLHAYDQQDAKGRADTADAIANVSGMICGVRPHEIIPLEKSQLPKSSLGKLSRAKIRTAYESGEYDDSQALNNSVIKSYRKTQREQPATATEELILAVICERFALPADEIGVGNCLFNFGVDSIDLIGFKQTLQSKLGIEQEIPLITILSNPTVRGMANALETISSPQVYNPVVTLQTHGSKTPLWLVHPGVGEVLVFLNLANYVTDRPVYALRARGFNDGEEFFSSIPEVVSTYHEHIRRVQPKGPYAIAGYSFGAMLAFEISKVLESQGEKIGFLGSFNLPPHIKHRMKELDWIEVVLNLSYFLDLTTEDYAHAVSAEMHKCTNDDVLEHIMRIAPRARLEELAMTKTKLATWASLAHAMQYAAREYEPSGSVAGMDIFFAIPLKGVAKSKDDWVANHLSKWKDFSRTEPRFHDVAGAHYTMMGPKHVLSFQKTLKSVLSARGL